MQQGIHAMAFNFRLVVDRDLLEGIAQAPNATASAGSNALAYTKRTILAQCQRRPVGRASLSVQRCLTGRDPLMPRAHPKLKSPFMDAQSLRQLIQAGLPDAEVNVQGDDGVHFEAVVISPSFTGKLPLARHRLVYATLGERMGGEIHALSLKTLTPNEVTGARVPGVR